MLAALARGTGSALVGPSIKYIFNAHTGSEQLFNLTTDPDESADISGSDAELLALWRGRMVNQFEQEGRGEQFVKDGALVLRPEAILHSPFFPTMHSTSHYLYSH